MSMRRDVNMRWQGIVIPVFSAILLSGCSTTYSKFTSEPPIVGSMTSTWTNLSRLPSPKRRVTVAVFDFPDLTGQKKPSTGVVSDLSTAVTQGASSILIEALKGAGEGGLFEVVDRTRDADQNRERVYIKDARTAVGVKKDVEAPIQPASYIVNGGIIAYERSVLSTDHGFSITGFGIDHSVLRNFVSVTMRLVDAETSKVISSVTASKAVDSYANQLFAATRGSAPGVAYPETILTKYPSPTDFINGNVLHSESEMTEIALREAIEAGLLQLIKQAQEAGIWRRDRQISVAQIQPARIHLAKSIYQSVREKTFRTDGIFHTAALFEANKPEPQIVFAPGGGSKKADNVVVNELLDLELRR